MFDRYRALPTSPINTYSGVVRKVTFLVNTDTSGPYTKPIDMELKAHFSNIHKVIIGHLEQAQTEIVAAIAWFTDRDIFEVLIKAPGCKVAGIHIAADPVDPADVEQVSLVYAIGRRLGVPEDTGSGFTGSGFAMRAVIDAINAALKHT